MTGLTRSATRTVRPAAVDHEPALLPAMPGGIGVIRPATAGGQLEREAPATNAATM